MKIVIQCSASKNKKAGTFGLNGRRVKFVAHPEFIGELKSEVLCRPDDPIPSGSTTWRDCLIEYNRTGKNPDFLLRAGELYSNPVYRLLFDHVDVGRKNLYILSGGWGLIRSDFRIPDYDITFSSQAEKWKRRTIRDQFFDFAQLTQGDLSSGEAIYFFGGKDYLPLYYRLTKLLEGRKVIYFNSSKIGKRTGYEYIRYDTTARTNWQYLCARDFIEGKISR